MSELTFAVIESAAGLGDLMFGGALPTVTDRNLANVMRATFTSVSQELAHVADSKLNISVESSSRIQAANAAVRSRTLAVEHMLRTPVQPQRRSAVGKILDVNAKSSTAVARQVLATVNQATIIAARASELKVDERSVIQIENSIGRVDAILAEGRLDEIPQVVKDIQSHSQKLERATQEEQVAKRQSALLANQSLARVAALWDGLHTGAIGQWINANGSEKERLESRIRKARDLYVNGQFVLVTTGCQELEADMTLLLETARAKVAREQRNVLADSIAQVLQDMGYSTSKSTATNQAIVSGSRSGRRMLTVALDDNGQVRIDTAKDRAFEGATCSVAVNDFLKRFTELTKAKIDIEDRAYLGGSDRPTGGAALNQGRRRITTANLISNAQRSTACVAVPPNSVSSAWARLYQ